MKSATEVKPAAAMTIPWPPPLVIGIGSPHGDDRAGWEVVERLSALDLSCSPHRLRKAAVPHDALDWFDPQTPTHVVDAIASQSDRLLRFELARDSQGDLQTLLTDQDEGPRSVAFPALRSHSTHQFDLRSVLELAAALNTLPQCIVLWAIPIEINTTPKGALDWSAAGDSVKNLKFQPFLFPSEPQALAVGVQTDSCPRLAPEVHDRTEVKVSRTIAQHLAALPNATLERHIQHAVQRIVQEITHA